MRRTAATICLTLLAGFAQAAVVTPIQSNAVTPVGGAKPYCVASAPKAVVGFYYATGVTSIVSVTSGVGNTLTITESDGTNTYESIVDSSVAGTTTSTACAVKQ